MVQSPSIIVCISVFASPSILSKFKPVFHRLFHNIVGRGGGGERE